MLGRQSRGSHCFDRDNTLEQVRELAVDERSDLYSLGCMAYEVFVGRVPFKEENALATMMKHVDGVPEALSVANPNMEFNEDIESIVAKTLEKNPDDRYRSVDDLKQALQSVRFPQRETNKPGKVMTAFSLPTSSTLVEEHSHGKAATRKSLLLISVLIIAVAAVGIYVALTGIKPQAPDVRLRVTAIDSGHSFVDPNKEPVAARVFKTGKSALGENQTRGDDRGSDPFADDATFTSVPRRGPGAYENPNATDATLKELADLSKYPDMTNLSLRGTGVEGPGLKYLVNRPLVALSLAQAPIRAEAFDYLNKMHLKDLSINYTRIPKEEYKRLHPTGLLILNVDAAEIDDTVIDTITKNIKSLSLLSIRDNPDVTDKSLEYLGRLKDLQFLNISETHMTGAGFRFLTSNKKLSGLTASKVPIFDDDLYPLLKLPLKNVTINAKYLTDKGLKILESLKPNAVVLENTSHLSARAKAALLRKYSPRRKINFQDDEQTD